MTTEVKKGSLLELALSLGFTLADENDPIYQNGWVIASTVGKELERLSKAHDNPTPKPRKGKQK
jgi:hypothetical protein